MKNFKLIHTLLLLVTFWSVDAFSRISEQDLQSPNFRRHGVGNPNSCKCNKRPISNMCKPICFPSEPVPTANKKSKVKKVAFAPDYELDSLYSRENGVDNNRDCNSFPPRSAARQTCIEMSRGFIMRSEPSPSFFLISCAESNSGRNWNLARFMEASYKTSPENMPGIVKVNNSNSDGQNLEVEGRFESIYCPAATADCTDESDSQCGRLPFSGEVHLNMDQKLLHMASNSSSATNRTSSRQFPGLFKISVDGTELTETEDCYHLPVGSMKAIGCQFPVESGGALRVDAVY